MKTINVGVYSITIQLEPDYSFNSSDNKFYDSVINLMGNEELSKTISIQVENDCYAKEVAFIVPYYTDINACALPAGESLFLMLNDMLCLFDLATLKIKKQNKLDNIGIMFEAYSYKQDFILYGEMDIYRITQDLSILWKFSGRDIFVRYASDETAFEMKSDRICLYDFEDNYYEIDYDGNLIK